MIRTTDDSLPRYSNCDRRIDLSLNNRNNNILAYGVEDCLSPLNIFNIDDAVWRVNRRIASETFVQHHTAIISWRDMVEHLVVQHLKTPTRSEGQDRNSEFPRLGHRLRAHTERRENEDTAGDLFGPSNLHKCLAEAGIGEQRRATLPERPRREGSLERIKRGRQILDVERHAVPAPLSPLGGKKRGVVGHTSLRINHDSGQNGCCRTRTHPSASSASGVGMPFISRSFAQQKNITALLRNPGREGPRLRSTS